MLPVPDGLGEVVRGHRERAGLTQQQLAAQAGMSLRALRDIEQNRVRRPRQRSVRRLAGALGLSEGDRAALLDGLRPRPAGTAAVPAIGVLGPLRVHRDGQVVDLTSPTRRRLLGVLALHVGQTVPYPHLVDVLWGDDPPTGCLNQLHRHAGRLAALLGSADAVVRSGGGYRLEPTGVDLDLARFDELVERARGSRSAEELLARALRWWRGPALADLGPGLVDHPAAVAAGQRRIDATLTYADLAITGGRYRAAVDRVHDVLPAEPLHEGLHARLMLALAGEGQQAAALRVYTDLRERLADELAIEPGPELRAAHLRVLRQNVVAVPSAGTARPPAPAQLPADVATFTGRLGYLRRLDALLPRDGRPAATVVISAIAGTAGIGKTALAVHWAHRVADRFPDGQLYVDLRGFDESGSPLRPDEAVRGFLDALGVPQQQIPADLPAQAALYRSLLVGRRLLVVLDNARDVDQVRPLLPGAPDCVAVVTSRNQLTGLVAAAGAHAVTLDLLSDTEARQLLGRRLGTRRVAAEPEAVDEIIARCAQLPLALAVVAARAAAHPTFPLEALAAELRDAHGDLDALASGDLATDVRAVFSWSYRTLGPAAARLFRLLGLHPGPDVTARAAASLAGEPVAAVRPALAELARAHMVTEGVPGRFTLHDLLRSYAAELARTVDTDADRRAARHRMLDHYLHSAAATTDRLYVARNPITPAPPPAGVTPEQPDRQADCVAWFEAEYPVLRNAVEQAAGTGFDAHVWQLAWTLSVFFERRGRLHDWVTVQAAAVAAAQRLGDRLAQAHAYRGLGRAYLRLGRLADAVDHLAQALDRFAGLGNLTGEANCHLSLSIVAGAQDRPGGAVRHAEQALELYRRAGHRAGEADALNNLGWYLVKAGEPARGASYCERALALYRQVGEAYNEAAAWDSLGYAYHHLGRHADAVNCYHAALRQHRASGHRVSEADALARLGDVHAAAADHPAARQAWQQALDIYSDVHHPDAEKLRAKLGEPRTG
jgi:DNA-binding SARP family transcriptional activator/tetratricopeptide (TPR) repeat protein